MKRNYLLWIGVVLIQSVAWAQETRNMDFSAVIESETAFGTGEKELQKSEFIVTPEVSYDLTKKLRITGIGRFYAEWADNLEPGSPGNESSATFSSRWNLGDRMELELRELYLDYWNKGLSVRVGKQQIVWGETDGLKLLDVVNPQYFREFILDDFDESRIPLWSVKTTFGITDALDAELIWIPDQSYHDIPLSNATFFPGGYFFPQPPPGMEVAFSPLDKPSRALADSEVGVRLSSFVKGWDLNFSYLYHYDDFQNFSFFLQPDLIQITPTYNRQHLAGLAFNKAQGPLVLRGEVAYHFDRSFVTNRIDLDHGQAFSNQLQAAMGLDWLFGETMLSAQVFNDWVVEDINLFNRDQMVWSGSFLVTQEMMNDNLKLETLLVQDFNRGDGMIRPSLEYLLNSQLMLRLGGDFFYGSRTGLFGQFNTRDRIYVGMELGI